MGQDEFASGAGPHRGEPMEVGASFTFQNLGRERSDAEVMAAELRLARMVEPLGFDSVWTTEHHFTDYMLMPSPLQFLTYMAGCTERIGLGTMVVVLPWHDPLRVAEEVALLEHMSGGRLILGLGRGAAKIEFEGFGVPMDTSRDHFIECAQMVLEALETGVATYAGAHVRQPSREIRPKPLGSFKGRAYAGTLSPEAAPIMAKLGLGIMVIPQKPWAQVSEELAVYERVFRAEHAGEAPPAPIASAWVYCHPDAAHAERMAREYGAAYYKSTIAHYRFDGAELGDTRGYDYYKRIQENLARTGPDKAADAFVNVQVWGTPEQCIEKARAVQRQIGCKGFNAVFSYAGMPYEAAEASMKLFAREVLPVLQQG